MHELGQDLLYLFGFAWILFGANYLAQYFQRVRLPLISGFIVTGVLVGPYVLNLISKDAIAELQFVNDISLAYIAFAAGAELYLKDLRGQLKSIAWNTFGLLAVTFVFSVVAVYFLSDYIPFMAGLSSNVRLVIALFMATIFVARSPSSAIAIVHEMRAKGPFTQTVMGVTVIKDVLVIILFALCVSISIDLLSESSFDITGLGLLILELALSFAFGFLLSKFINLILSFPVSTFIKAGLLLITGYGVFFFAHASKHLSEEWIGTELFFEPLLICIIASFATTNFSRYRPEFQFILHRTGPIIYLSFFTLTGIMISLEVLVEVWLIALGLFFVRLISMVFGAYFGAVWAGDPKRVRWYNWMPYVTQAGVGVGLAIEVANEFPAWGHEFATIVIAVIVLNQFVGPPLFKYALNKIGESHKRLQVSGFAGFHDAIIFGLEDQSLALARLLKNHDWDVTVATLKHPDEFEPNAAVNIQSIARLDVGALDQLKANKADAVVLMLSDQENLTLCELIYEYVGTNNIIVRLNDQKKYKKFHELGCLIVDPDTAIVSLMDNFVRSPVAASMLLGAQEGQETIDLEVRDKSLHGVALRNLRLPSDVIVLSVKRKGQSIISHGYTRLRKKDIVTLVGSPESLQKLQLMFGEAKEV